MKGLFTALVIVGVLYGVYQGAMIGYGWFQLSSVLDDVATAETPALASAAQSGAFFGASDRYGRIREGVVKGAREAGVPLRAEDVTIDVSGNMLNIRLAWDAPMIVYDGKAYVEVPMTLSRAFALNRPGR